MVYKALQTLCLGEIRVIFYKPLNKGATVLSAGSAGSGVASCVALTHIAGGVKLLGSLLCTAPEHGYTAEGVQRLCLSLGACKALQLAPQAFPSRSLGRCSREPQTTTGP